jgi:hypothetical protein
LPDLLRLCIGLLTCCSAVLSCKCSACITICLSDSYLLIWLLQDNSPHNGSTGRTGELMKQTRRVYCYGRTGHAHAG